jgi:hypothetical protein
MEIILVRTALWLSVSGAAVISIILAKEYESQFYSEQDYTALDSLSLWTSISSALITLSVGLFIWTLKATRDL